MRVHPSTLELAYDDNRRQVLRNAGHSDEGGVRMSSRSIEVHIFIVLLFERRTHQGQRMNLRRRARCTSPEYQEN